jgi:hypothetical protein
MLIATRRQGVAVCLRPGLEPPLRGPSSTDHEYLPSWPRASRLQEEGAFERAVAAALSVRAMRTASVSALLGIGYLRYVTGSIDVCVPQIEILSFFPF